MSYWQGYLLPVPRANKERYIAICATFWAILGDAGALSMCETWGEDVPDGEVTSFRKAVQAGPDEAVVLAWVEWPDRATCDAGMEAMRTDPRMEGPADLPFDGMRLTWGGFQEIFRA